MRPDWRRLLLGAVTGTVVAVIYSAVPRSGVLDRLETDRLVRLMRRTPRAHASPVVIVGLDEPAMRSMSTTSVPGFDRAAFSRLVKMIAAARPRVLGVDVLFAKPRAPDGDRLLGEALAGAPSPVVAAALEFESAAGEPRLVEPMAELSSRGLAFGVANTAPDDDGVVRRVALLRYHQGNRLPHLGLELARRYLGSDLTRVTESGLWLRSPQPGCDRFVPIDAATGSTLLPYGGPDRFSVLDASKLLGNNTLEPGAAEMLQGRIVLVGATGGAQGDLHLTPYGTATGRGGLVPGVVVLAHIVDGIVSDRLLAQPGPGVRSIVGGGAIVLGTALLSLCPPFWAVGLLVLLGSLTAIGTMIAFDHGLAIGGLTFALALLAGQFSVLTARLAWQHGETLARPDGSSASWLARTGRTLLESATAPESLAVTVVVLESTELTRRALAWDARRQAEAVAWFLEAVEGLSQAGAWVQQRGPFRVLAMFHGTGPENESPRASPADPARAGSEPAGTPAL
ncbi:MAG: CHASE2 domain-containing protein, partial [Candidatus Riflebacteria bacterium]|nr:CHASE2 domain-containing protein [Candidatus Riflebacteria bacterium]